MPWYNDEDDNLILLDNLSDVELNDSKYKKTDVTPATYTMPPVFKRVQTFEVLGVMVNDKGDCDDAVDFQLKKSLKGFFKMKDTLQSRWLSRKLRLHRYATRIVPIALHGSGSWTWSQTLVNKNSTFSRIAFSDGSFTCRVLARKRSRNRE